jgi:hypothetical protein
MDHKEAIRLQAAEKYVLGELRGTLREEFEEHFFDCAECAEGMKAAAIFVDNSREVLRQGARNVPQEQTGSIWERWFGWLKPAIAVPAFALLLLALGYQSFVTVPRLKTAGGTRPQLLNTFSLVASNVRGGEEVKVQVRKDEAFALDFDFLPTNSFDHYLCQLQDEAERAAWQLPIPADKANQEVHLLVPAGLVHSGRYSVVVSGDPVGKGDWIKENQVSKINFVVEIRP